MVERIAAFSHAALGSSSRLSLLQPTTSIIFVTIRFPARHSGACRPCRPLPQRTPTHASLAPPPAPREPEESSPQQQQRSPPNLHALPSLTSAPSARGPLVGLLWLAFVFYIFAFGPGNVADLGVIALILQTHFADVNSLFLASFYALGHLGVCYATLFLPAAGRKHLLPTIPSSLLGALLGFLAFGPYIALRTYSPSITIDEVQAAGPVVQWVETKVHAVAMVLFALYIYFMAFQLTAPDDMRDALFYLASQGLAELFRSDRWAHATLIDGTILSVLLYGPLTEDMRRRGWIFDKQNLMSYAYALCILLTPCLGPAVYFLLRPQLPQHRPKY